MTGTMAVVLFILIPSQALSPTAVPTDRLTTPSVAIVPLTERSNRSVKAMITAYIAGTRVSSSHSLIRTSVSLITARPVSPTVRSGRAARRSR